MARATHIPLRSCAACRERFSKRDMIRIVRSTDGNVEVDSTGRKPGRGTYLCPRKECWQTGLQKRRIDNALRSPLVDRDREVLTTYYNEQLHPAGEGEGI